MRADACEIFTDVDGVYTTDPRMLPEARQMTQVSYDEMLGTCKLKRRGNVQSIDRVCKEIDVPIRVRSSFPTSLWER
ncbi:MAG: hypothetical protein U0905_18335 [Pirellulales bacterium]